MEELEREGPSKREYRAWALATEALSIWHQPWWLDASAGPTAWNVVVSKRGDVTHAFLPFVLVRRFGFLVISQPRLAQSLGPVFTSACPTSLSRQHEVLATLQEALPASSSFDQNWSTEQTNWLPFYWAGYSQTTRYTYRVTLEDTQASQWSKLSSMCRRAVRKATDRFGLRVITSSDAMPLYRLCQDTYSRKGTPVPFSYAELESLVSSGRQHESCSLYYAIGQDEQIYAGALVLHDSETGYYLIGGLSSRFRETGAMNLVLWEAINDCRRLGLNEFDFEGSMIQSIESFFRSFGALPVQYFRVWKYHRKLLRARSFLLGNES